MTNFTYTTHQLDGLTYHVCRVTYKETSYTLNVTMEDANFFKLYAACKLILAQKQFYQPK